MRRVNPEQWEASTGFLAVLAAAVAAYFAEPWPLESGADFVRFLAEHRLALMGQSLAISISMGLALWFLSVLREFIGRAEGFSGRYATLVFGAGLLWCGMTVLAQAPQLVLTLPSQQNLEPSHARVLADLCFVMVCLANVPLVVMLTALTLLSLRTHVFPTWLAVFSAFAGLVSSGVFLAGLRALNATAPQGWLTIALTPALALWLVPTAMVMVRRLAFTEHKPLVHFLK